MDNLHCPDVKCLSKGKALKSGIFSDWTDSIEYSPNGITYNSRVRRNSKTQLALWASCNFILLAQISEELARNYFI